MNDHLKVLFTAAAEKDLREVAKKDAARAAALAVLIEEVEENGWILGLHAQVLKVLRPGTSIGEIRDLGSGGYRLFFFWHDVDEHRELWVCRLLPKRDVEGKRRFNAVCESVEAIRRRFYQEGG